MDGFSSHKMIYSDSKKVNFSLDFGFGKKKWGEMFGN